MKHIISTIFILVFYSFILNANSKTFQKLKTLDSTFAQKIEIDWRARDYYLDTIVSKKGEFNNFPDSLIYSSMLSKWINEYNVRYRYKNNNLLGLLKDSLKLKNLSAEPYDILLNDSTTNKGLKSPNLYIAILRSALSCESIINSKQRDTLSNILLSELENYEDLYIETYIDSKRDSLVQIINKYPNNPRIVRAIVNDINRKFHLSKDDLYYGVMKKRNKIN